MTSDITTLPLRDQVHALIERSVEYRYQKFQVVETATSKKVGEPSPYAFAKWVRDVRDWFNDGKFLVKRVK